MFNFRPKSDFYNKCTKIGENDGSTNVIGCMTFQLTEYSKTKTVSVSK